MPEWLRPLTDTSIPIAPVDLALRLIAALVLGLGVAGIHRATRRASTETATFPATLVLLCVLIAMVTQVIGDNVARAFSLVGALSIVRFRTVVQDTKDTAFVIFAVAVGMAVGAQQILVSLGGLLVVGITAWLFRDPAATGAAGRLATLTLKCGWVNDIESLIQPVLAPHASAIVLQELNTIRQGTGLEARFHITLTPTARVTQLLADLNRLEGVQAIDLKVGASSL